MKSTLISLGLVLLVLALFFQCQTLETNKLPDVALQAAQALTAEGWQKILNNEFRTALSNFEKALNRKPEYLPAARGLGLLYYIRANEFDCFDQLFNVAAAAPADPLSIVLLKFIEDEVPFRKGQMERLYAHYQKLARNSSLPYWIQRFAWDRAAEYAADHVPNQQVRNGYAAKLNNLRMWNLAGPFSNVSHSALLNDPDPEIINKVRNIYSSFSGKDNMEIKTLKVDEAFESPDGWVHLSNYLDFPVESAVYAEKVINIEESSEYLFIVSQEGALNFWLDDKSLIKDPVYRSGTDLHWIKVSLEKGKHTIVLQLSNQYDHLAFRVSMVNFFTKAGRQKNQMSLPDFSVAPSAIPALSNTSIQNPLLYSLAEMLGKNPDDAENHFWINWLINNMGDGKTALELVQDSLKTFTSANSDSREALTPPLLFQYLKAISLQNSNNYIDARNLLIKITNAKEVFAPATAFVIKDYINHHHLEKAGDLLKKITAVNPNWFYGLESELLLALALNNEKEAKEKLDKLIRRYSNLYPDAPGLFSTYLSREKAGSFQNINSSFYTKLASMGMPMLAYSLEMDQAFREENYTRAAQLADTITKMHPYDIDAWETLVLSRFRFDKYEPTRMLCERVLQSFPYNTALLTWQMKVSESFVNYLTELEKDPDPRLNHFLISDNISREKVNLNTAGEKLLNIAPDNFALRTALRMHEKQKSFDDVLKIPLLDKTIEDFEKKEQTWQGDVVMVLNDTTEYFFKQGASRTFRYYILKILSENGVISESTQELDYNPRKSELNIIQAFLLKPDGSTIDAIRRGNLLSYQGLQSGDYLVCMYSVNHYEPGELNNQYWTSCEFNSFYPVSQVRFKLLYPSEMVVNIEKHNTREIEIKEDEYTFDKNYKYVQYSAENLAPVTIESHLPDSRDLFTWYDFSTLKDWQPVVRWYEHLSAGQCEVTPKIREKTAEITQGLDSREERIKSIFDFVSQKIKYEDLIFQYSAYKPQRAESILADGYGDCKDKATLLITMLKADGIPSYIALNTPDYAGNSFYLPSTRFNHAIIVVPGEEGAEEQILDPTSEYLTYPDLPSGSIGSPLLVIKPEVNELIRIPEPATRGKTMLMTGLKKDGQVSILDGSILYNNFRAGEIRALLFTNDEEFKKKLFSSFFNYNVPGFRLDKVEYSNMYTLKDDPRIEFKASIPEPIRDYGNRLAVLELPWLIGLPAELLPAIGEEERQSPFSYKNSRYADPLCQTIYFTIPENYKVISLPANLEFELPDGGYIHYIFELNGRQLVASRDFYLPFMEVSGKKFNEIKKNFLHAVQKEQEKIILQK